MSQYRSHTPLSPEDSQLDDMISWFRNPRHYEQIKNFIDDHAGLLKYIMGLVGISATSALVKKVWQMRHQWLSSNKKPSVKSQTMSRQTHAKIRSTRWSKHTTHTPHSPHTSKRPHEIRSTRSKTPKPKPKAKHYKSANRYNQKETMVKDFPRKNKPRTPLPTRSQIVATPKSPAYFQVIYPLDNNDENDDDDDDDENDD
jgi:hypothetical protein